MFRKNCDEKLIDLGKVLLFSTGLGRIDDGLAVDFSRDIKPFAIRDLASNVGKRLVTLNFAAVLAQSGQHVLVIDGHQPSWLSAHRIGDFEQLRLVRLLGEHR